MGRKRKAGSVPSPLVPSLPAVARPESSAGRREKKKKKRGGGRRCQGEHKHRVTGPATAERATPTAPTRTSPSPSTKPCPTSAPSPLDGAIRALLSPPTPPEAPAPAYQDGTTPAQGRFEDEPGKSPGGTVNGAELGLTPSDVIGLLPASGWRLGSCWGSECGCSAFRPASSLSPLPAAGVTPGCACGHRSCAHELVDANDDAEEVALPPNRQYRYYPGDGDSSRAGAPAAPAANETAARLRRLFSSIRNARAVGECALFEDSEGVRGWGSGWFLSRCARSNGRVMVRKQKTGLYVCMFFHSLPRPLQHYHNIRLVSTRRGGGGCRESNAVVYIDGACGDAPHLSTPPFPRADRLARRYIHQARQAQAALGGALHDPPAVARCLAAAEALLSGDAAGQWTVPNSLPSSLIYRVRVFEHL